MHLSRDVFVILATSLTSITMVHRRLAQAQRRQLAKAFDLRQRDVRRLWAWFDRLDSGGVGLLTFEVILIEVSAHLCVL